MGGRIRVEKEDGIGWVVFDHPERRNAITIEMWEEIPRAVDAHARDPEVRVVILRGAGEEAFVSGADISEFERVRTGREASAEYDARNQRAFHALAHLEKPLLAMIHGFCVGGGCAIAVNADLRYAAEDAVFAIPAARLGLGYALRGVETLVQVVGPSNAKELLFTAQRLRAPRALQMGLVNAVLPKAELETHVREVASILAANAPLTLRSVKLAVREIAKDASARDEAAVDEAVRRCFESDDYKEGVRAFLEKRPPRFRGR